MAAGYGSVRAMRAKAVVIGGGVMGTAIALKLAQRFDPLRDPVVLLERGDLAAGSSGRSGAILRQNYAHPDLSRMARDSLREYAAFEGRTARSIGFRRTGVLWIAGPGAPEWIERLEANRTSMVSMGIRARSVGPDEMRELVPGLVVDDDSAGLWEPDGAVVDPVLTVEAFAALARTYGAVTRVGAAAQALVTEGQRVVGVETDQGSYEAEIVIVCAGPWSRALLARHGHGLPLRNMRPENHFLRLPHTYHEATEVEDKTGDPRGVNLEDPLEAISEELSGTVDPETTRAHPVLLDLEHGFYARCEPLHARTRVGSMEYGDQEVEDPDTLDEEVSAEAKSWAREVLGQRMPVYRSEADAGSLAALYTLTPDAQPMIGPLAGCEGLFVATGFSGHGFKLAPSVAEGVAQMVTGQAISAFDPELFDPGRFGEDPDEAVWEGAFGL